MHYDAYIFPTKGEEFDECIECCKQLLHYELKSRVKWDNLLEINFVKECYELVNKLFTKDEK